MKKFHVAVVILLGISTVGCGAGGDASGAPTSLGGTEMGGGFHLTWTDNSTGEDGFVVEQRVGEGSFTELAQVPFDTTQYMVDGGEAGKQHSFRVLAKLPSGMSGPSNEVAWTP